MLNYYNKNSNNKFDKNKYKISNDNISNDKNSNFSKNKNLIKQIKHKKSKNYKRLMLIVKLSILGVVLLLGFVVFSLLGKFNRKVNLQDIGLNKTDEAAEKQISDITNILLLGIDDNNVSDAIMLASMNKTHKKINLISIARDSLVTIEPKNKKQYRSKINEAYSNGGVETTLKTINQNFGLRIMNYMTVNFESLGDVIDELGGIDVEISREESNQIDGIINTTKSLKKRRPKMLRSTYGFVHLNGAQSVAYARIRKVPTLTGLRDDFGRSYRQRKIMELVFQKTMEFDKSKVFGLIKVLLPNITTSLNLKTLYNIYQCIKGKGYEIVQTQIPMPAYTMDPDYMYNTKSTVYYDLNYAGDVIKSIIYENNDQETFMENNPPHVKHIVSNPRTTSSKFADNFENKKNYNSNSKLNYGKSKTNSMNKKHFKSNKTFN